MDNIKESILKKRAFTIIEIMVSVAIISIISVGMLAIIVRSMHAYYTLSALNELNNNASFTADELTKDLLGSDISLIRIASIQDPATGQWHDMLVFPALSGTNPIDGNGNPNWHNVVVYYPFTTASGINQLRKYAHTNISLTSDDFPLPEPVVTATAINLSKKDLTPLVSFNRATSQVRVLANFISTEDANSNQSLDANENDTQANLPMDNADGVLDTGVDYSVSGDTVFIKLFLEKPITQIGGAISRRVSMTLNSAATLRN